MLPKIVSHFDGHESIVEPFFGGGAVSFALAAAHRDVRVHANEKLEPVVAIYEALRRDPAAFIEGVEAYADAYLSHDSKEARRAFYYQVRDAYLAGELDGPEVLLFMLRTCYSGLYRTSKTVVDRFNTPHGFGAEKPGFHQPANLLRAAEAISEWSFTSADFADTLDVVTDRSFVFLDPPYRETYTGYTGDGFGPRDQERVAEYAVEAAARGARVVVTNKCLGDTWYEDNFPGFTIERAPIRYQVNADCASVGRPQSYEVVIHNNPDRLP